MIEEWIPVSEFSSYDVSNTGKVRYGATGRVKNPARNQQGIVMVNFSINGVQYVRSLAKLVAEHFLPLPQRNDFTTPIHLNGDRTDCAADNLVLRPNWFAREYHAQFKSSSSPMFRGKIYDLETDEIYDNTMDVAVRFGLLDKDVYLSSVNNAPVFPTYQKFRILD